MLNNAEKFVSFGMEWNWMEWSGKSHFCYHFCYPSKNFCYHFVK